jgi:hypothetical protein
MNYIKTKPLLYFNEVAGKTLQWYCGDDSENYTDHNKSSWKYFNTRDKLFYEFNSLGYRTRELDTLDDYILVLGCSYTEGVGLYENEIWCNVLGKQLGIDILNLAKAGTGPDIVNFNTQLFVKNKFVKPRAVINQWPQATRKSFGYLESNSLRLEDRNVNNWIPGTNYDSDWYFNRWIAEDGQLEYENSLHINSVTNLWNALGVPVFNWTFGGDFMTKYSKEMVSVLKLDNTDKARDNAHDGPLIHKEVVEKIRDKVECMI